MSTDKTGYAMLAQVATLEALQEDLTRCATASEVKATIAQRIVEIEQNIKRQAHQKKDK